MILKKGLPSLSDARVMISMEVARGIHMVLSDCLPVSFIHGKVPTDFDEQLRPTWTTPNPYNPTHTHGRRAIADEDVRNPTPTLIRGARDAVGRVATHATPKEAMHPCRHREKAMHPFRHETLSPVSLSILCK